MPQLSKSFLLENEPELAPLFALPEKVLQFGTGVLLRGLPDFFIEKANRAGLFNGRVVAVKSTDRGDAGAFGRQDNLYTLCTRGLENGQKVEENLVCTAISRVLVAREKWPEVLACARNPELQIVISNTTEVGLQMLEEDVRQAPPQSFPGKLLAVLLERCQCFAGDPARGLLIVPTELIPGNGDKLKAFLLELARFNRLDAGFTQWLETACIFCNSLVDRIVPGKPAGDLPGAPDYADELLTAAEPYRLWAIEGDERVKKVLSFCSADPGVIIAPDIELYRELKLRLLNGTHTLSCGLAWLAGFDTVGQAMGDPLMATYIERLMLREIAPAIPFPVAPEAAERFGRQVLERFRNPFVEHKWLSITVQYSAKMRARNVPVLLEHYRQGGGVPESIALGFAAFLLFYAPASVRNEAVFGATRASIDIQDDHAAYFFDQWEKHAPADLPRAVLSDAAFWGTDLAALPGFAERVTALLLEMLEKGARECIYTN